MDDDMFRWLCVALLKSSEGKPIALDEEELGAAFELKLKTASDGLVVQVISGGEG